ncbi:hypothetical protein C1H46_014423 [Malus baccata]|uniref:Cytochrome P450 n=1 Tax=Malus baccata TaxID=106549 RepID=A0A540MNF8_MALBA|nr:hypothetical protein C1H46_014423 [Malus baccata]
MVELMKLITETLCLLHPFSFKYFLLVTIFLILIYKWSFTSTPNSSPPSPRKLPVIGNLHQLGLYPHRSLRALAQRHGSLMMLHFGSMPVLVVSSAEAASEVMKTHDITFSDRPKITFFKKLFYDFKDVASAPYGEYWRQVKSICVLNLLSSKKVRSFRAVREEEVKSMINNIMKQSTSTTSITVGTKYNDGGENEKMFKGLSVEFTEIMSRINIGDYIPWLSWFSRLNGLDAKQDDLAKRYDDFLETVVQEHMDGDHVRNEDEKDLVDVLLSLQKENVLAIPIDRVCIKAITVDLFTAGTDTISTALEWTMSELLRHPRVMKKLQNEAVIKETLRLHPPLPLLLPRLSSQDVKISGYDIKPNTQVIVNAWQIGRDPKSYNNPEEYKPERFLSNDIDFKGTDYELIPFGAGRRGCPGIQFAAAVKEIVLASLVHKFDWALPGGARGEDLDMTESPGGTVHKKYPLKVVAIPYSC